MNLQYMNIAHIFGYSLLNVLEGILGACNELNPVQLNELAKVGFAKIANHRDLLFQE